MSSANKRSLFDGDDDDDDGVPKLAAKRAGAIKVAEENPLSFFSFGSATGAPTANSRPASVPKSPSQYDDTDDFDDDDDEFFQSPPGSIKKPKISASKPAILLPEDDELGISGVTLDHGLSFSEAFSTSAARPASADPQKSSAASQTDKQRIAALEEQLAKAQRSIKKYQDKEKADAAQLEAALQGIESNLTKQVNRANKAEQEKSRLEKESSALIEQVAQLQAQNRQQAALIAQMNHSGIPIPTTSAADLDWYTIQEKHKTASRLLLQASQEAKSGIDLLLKNAPVLAEVAQMLKDLGRISEEKTH
jgi:hypothetical protein